MLMGTWHSTAFRLLFRVWIYIIFYRIVDTLDCIHCMCSIPATSYHVGIGVQSIPDIHLAMRIVADNILSWWYQNYSKHEERRASIESAFIISTNQESICDRSRGLYHDGNNHCLRSSSQRLVAFFLMHVIAQLDVHLFDQYSCDNLG